MLWQACPQGRIGGASRAAAELRGHKIAPHPIAGGATVRRYGRILDRATRDIAEREHVDVRNLAWRGAMRAIRPRRLRRDTRNPNFAGIPLVGPGCEVMPIPALIGRA